MALTSCDGFTSLFSWSPKMITFIDPKISHRPARAWREGREQKRARMQSCYWHAPAATGAENRGVCRREPGQGSAAAFPRRRRPGMERRARRGGEEGRQEREVPRRMPSRGNGGGGGATACRDDPAGGSCRARKGGPHTGWRTFSCFATSSPSSLTKNSTPRFTSSGGGSLAVPNNPPRNEVISH